MNRVIKFRAWNKEMKHMVYPSLEFGRNIYPCFYKRITNTDEEGEEVVMEMVSVDHILQDPAFEVMQFTGLHDKNGVEIYEGDHDDEGNMIDFCETCSGYQFFQIDVPTKDIIFCHNCEGNFMLDDHIHDFTITGNIHQTNTP